ncbi:hypothetical protein SAMN04515666_103610 [Bosea lupini]|uniref:Uncharacterized protein n=1 Tax=Bosea lupini TaxID=1036779 RepID=A0A1H7PW37_9HYPH|nr:hypothetical protein [Bosea lupini]SEL39287.1 hypothetical protein SAMN04515666_103610 [Bosea lupini]
MNPELLPLTVKDRLWLAAHPASPFRFRPPTSAEARAAGVQNPEAVAIVVRGCSSPGFVIVSSERGSDNADAVLQLAAALDIPREITTKLADLLPGVRPNNLAFAAAELIKQTPFCLLCTCGVRWAVVLAGIALETAPKDCTGMIAIDEAWEAAKHRGPPARFRISDAPVVAASAAIRGIGRS